MKSVTDLFLESQSTVQNHGKLVKSMINLYKKTEFGKFWSEFTPLLKRALVVFEREPAIERCLEFVAKFATSLKNTDDDQGKEKEKEEEEESGEIDEDIHQFLLKLFDFCLQHNNASDRAVRFRVCQLVNKLLAKMGENAQIDDELYDRIYECMLQRLRDVFPIVRIQAVFALARLQDPSDEDCPVINGYLFLLSCDTNSDVRRAALTCIAASTKTLPNLLERTRDAKHTVRRLAYQILAEKVHIRALTIAQRIMVLDNGLQDRDETVRESCTTRLLQAWLRTFQGNTLDLLKCLDVENSVKTAELVLNALFKKTPAHELVANFDLLNKELVMEAENVSCESVLYWRVLCKHLSTLGLSAEQHLEKLLPLPTAFGDYLTQIVAAMKEETDLDAQLTNEFILHQLLELGLLLDLSDEAGRKVIGRLIHYLIMSDLTTVTIIPSLVGLFEKYQKNPVTRINALCESIADIRQPITVVEDKHSAEEKRQIEIKMAQVRVKLNQLREELEESVSKQDFTKAAAAKEQVEELEAEKQRLQEMLEQPITQEVRTEKTDSVTLLKCVAIAAAMLTSVSFKQIPVSLQTLIETLMLPCIQNEDPAVRNLAVKALGLSCLMSMEIAKKHLFLFITVSQLDVDAVKVTALQVVFDLLLTFGFETLDTKCTEAPETDDKSDTTSDDESKDLSEEEDDDEDGVPKPKQKKEKERSQSLIFILTDLLNSKVSELRTVAAEGLAKLLLAGRIVAPKLISRLLLLWYNPVTEDDTLLRHCLGTFFPVYAFASLSNQAVVEEAILPTLRTLLNAPPSSPLAEIDINNVIDLLTQLTNARHLLSTNRAELETTSHDTLALKLCNDILSELQSEDSCSIRPYCRTLGALELSAAYSGLKDLSVLSEEILEKLSDKDKQSKKTVQKFHDMIQGLMKKTSDETDAVFEETTTTEADVTETKVDTSETTTVDQSEVTSDQTNVTLTTDSPAKTTCTTLTVPDDEEEKNTPVSPTTNRPALGPVAQNQSKAASPAPDQKEEDQDLSETKTSKTKKTPAKSTKRTKTRQKLQTQDISSSEPENDVHTAASNTIRRSSRTTRSKADKADTTVQSETESPLRKALRASTRREQPKRTKRQ